MTERITRVPNIIGWEITNQCNLTCPHCFTAAGKRPHDELTTAECHGLIDIMAGIGVRHIGWTGGEPLLREDLEALTIYAWQQGIKCNITTNGVLLDQARAKSLYDAGIRTIQISLDGSTPARNNPMRGTTDEEYWKIIEAIRHCKALNMRVFLAALLGQENLDDAPHMVKLAKRERVDSLRFCAFTPVGRGKHSSARNRLLFSEQLRALLAFVQEAQDDGSLVVTFDVGFGPVPPDYNFHKCAAGVETFYLKGNGDLYPCTALTDKCFLVGNVRRQSLAELWSAPEMTAMAEFPREQIHGVCRSCDNFLNCRGACRGATLAHTGDLLAPFPTCLYQLAINQD